MKAYERRTIKRIKELLPKIMPPGAQVILFGSRARGDARPDSDWDILVVLDKEKLDFSDYDYSYPLVELGGSINADISPVTYARGEWERFHFAPFQTNVKQDGIRLWN